MVPINVPNVLTILRILAVPVLVVALLDGTANGDLLAAIVFSVASLTDYVDGYLARSRNWVTTFGKLMDPIADKLLIIAALVALVSLDRVAAWVAMVIIAREFLVTAMRMAAAQQGVIVPAGALGKAKTVTQVAAILALIAAGDDPPLAVDLLVYVAVAVTVASGVDYAFGIRRKVNAARSDRRAKAHAPAPPADVS
jgi:CDP-diacylglycerol---glycerol-3-phosphate 3-phosphatidyltransferase